MKLILDYFTPIVTLFLFYLLYFLNIGNSNIERSIFVFGISFIFVVIGFPISKKINEKTGDKVRYVIFSILLEGILIFTSAVFVIIIYSVILKSNVFSLQQIGSFSIFYLIFTTLIKIVSKPKHLFIVVFIGLGGPIIIGFFWGIILAVLKIFNIFVSETETGIYLWAIFGVCLTFLIGSMWHYGLSRLLNSLREKITR